MKPVVDAQTLLEEMRKVDGKIIPAVLFQSSYHQQK